MIGTTLGGKYRLVRLLGAGAMGAVYEAYDPDARHVAVKVIHAGLIDPGRAGARRFRREVRAARALSSPHVVRVLDDGVDEVTSHLYLVMEHLVGEDLQRLIDREGPIEPSVALRIAAQALLGIEHAHQAGVVHRDVKPANLFLARVGSEIVVKVLDFGIAKIVPSPLVGASTAGLTDTGQILGSPLYMSPEQVNDSREVDARSDVWSLGSALYCTLAGRAPHQHIASLGRLLVAICSEPARPLCKILPSISPAIERVVHGALEIDSEKRYPSASSMLDALRTLLPEGLELHEEDLPRAPEIESSPTPARAATTLSGDHANSKYTGSAESDVPYASTLPASSSEHRPPPAPASPAAPSPAAAPAPAPAPAARPEVQWGYLGAMVTLLALGFVAGARFGPRTPDTGATRHAIVVVEPSYARVKVDGMEVQTSGGFVELDGSRDGVHLVHVEASNRAVTQKVIVSAGRADPRIIDLGLPAPTLRRPGEEQ